MSWDANAEQAQMDAGADAEAFESNAPLCDAENGYTMRRMKR
jgi:hypothetical protein